MRHDDSGGTFRPDPAYDAPGRLDEALRRRLLPLVSRPGRYLGGELGAVRAPWSDDRANILLTYPDAYELGISNNGLRQLYAALNAHDGTFADLAFAPWPDMETRMRAEGLPLWGLESRVAARKFDVFGFSLGYELCYTNLLTMLDLAGLPLRCTDRGEGDPVVIAGGHCAANPTVLAPFVDVFCIGDGEEIVLEIADAVNAARAAGEDRAGVLARIRALKGTWWEGKAEITEGRVVTDLENFPPLRDLVPTIEAVHDRLSLEVMRGCVRGCRFCQAGMITRPVRERDVRTVVKSAVEGARELGWREISLLSLSTCDYTGLGESMRGILEGIAGDRTSLELPSLRVDALDESVYEMLSRERPGSFTFAPEAGSQRLRDVINKNITEQDVLTSARRAFESGAKKVKLYFMIGLPTETDDDLLAIADLVRKVAALAPRGGAQVTASLSPHSPKAHTPFQWAGQIDGAEIERRNRLVLDALRGTKVKVSLRDPRVSNLEGALGLGDGRLADVLERAWRLGARFDGWDEEFKPELWDRAFADCGVDPADYLRERGVDEPLPWDGVFAQVAKDFLAADWRKALAAETVPDCRLEGGCERCDACTPVQKHVFALQPDGSRARRGRVAMAGAEVKHGASGAAAPAATGSRAFDPRNARADDPDREEPRWRNWRNRAVEKCWYRVEYAKHGDPTLLGHLDFQRQLQLALRRARLPLAYSQGFNPHPLIKFGPPLSVGVAGDHELMDIALTHQVPGWEHRLNGYLPRGLRLLACEMVGATVPESIDQGVDRMDYRVEMPREDEGGPEPAAVGLVLEAFLSQDRVIHLRRRPKGDVEVDLRPLIDDGGLAVEPSDAAATGPVLRIRMLRRTDRPGLPIHEFLAALFGDALPEPRYCRVTRTALLTRTDTGDWTSPLQRIRDHNSRLWLRKHLSA